MIDIKNIVVMNFQGAFRGMRNPMKSWDQSDSAFYCDDSLQDYRCEYREGCGVKLREKDLTLAQKLILAGTDHSKFMRQIFVSMDINAPLYWWKEMDTYKVATVANSESTMHKLATTPITRECFSFDSEFNILLPIDTTYFSPDDYDFFGWQVDNLIQFMENLRLWYLKTKDIRYWRALVQLLPESWNQMRTWTADYAVLRNIYFARRNHKLTEWHTFCKMIEELPYGRELICIDNSEERSN